MGDILLNAPLISPMLPSPSVLTGNYRPQTAAAYMEQTLAEAKARAAGSRVGTPSLTHSHSHLSQQLQPQPKGSVEEVSTLRTMASKHLGHLRQARPTPYPPQQPPLPSRCLSTPPLRSQPATPQSQQQRPHPSALLPQQQQSQTPPPLPQQPQTPPPLTPPPPPLQQQQQSQSQVLFDLAPREAAVASPAAAAAVAAAGAATSISRAGTVHPSSRLGSASGGGAAASIAATAGVGVGVNLGLGVLGLDSPTAAPEAVATPVAAAGGPPHHPFPPPHPHSMITHTSNHPLFTASQVLPRLVLPAPDEAITPLTASPSTTALLAGGGGGAEASPHGGRPAPAQHHPLSPAASAAPAAPSPQPHPHAHGQSNPHPHFPPRFQSHASSLSYSRPTTSMSVQDLSLPRPGPRVSSRSPTRGSMTQLLDLSRSGSASSGGGAVSAAARAAAAAAGSSRQGSPVAALAQLPMSAGGATEGGGGGGAAAAASSSPSRSAPTRFQYTATRMASEAAAAAQGGAEGPRLPSGGFKVTRGMLYSVFQELDEFDSGRLTYSAFEQAACKIGMRPAQARRLFEHLDPQGRGFATMREWSSPSLQRQMEAFTRLYVQATRGSDGRPKNITEVRTMHMAIQMAMVKLQLKRCGRAVSLDRLVQAFGYMDRDSNGALNAEEVEDALNSLGIFVTKEVVDTIMRTFDKDGNGCVDYYEFVKSLYPTLDTSVYQQ